MALNNLTDEDLIDRAKKLMEKGGCSGGTFDFIDHLLWHGFSPWDDGRAMQVERLEELLLLHGI